MDPSFMAERVVYRTIAYGEWTRPRMRNFREQCCDCGLIHRLHFRLVDGRIELRTRRDNRATAPARRRFRMLDVRQRQKLPESEKAKLLRFTDPRPELESPLEAVCELLQAQRHSNRKLRDHRTVPLVFAIHRAIRDAMRRFLPAKSEPSRKSSEMPPRENTRLRESAREV